MDAVAAYDELTAYNAYDVEIAFLAHEAVPYNEPVIPLLALIIDAVIGSVNKVKLLLNIFNPIKLAEINA